MKFVGKKLYIDGTEFKPPAGAGPSGSGVQEPPASHGPLRVS